jgi:hypothetical protein
MMVEEKKGVVKVTVEVELNEAIMEMLKMRRMMRRRDEKSE